MEFIGANAKGAKFQLPFRMCMNPHCAIWRSGDFLCGTQNIGGRMSAIATSVLLGRFLVGTEWPNPEFDGLTALCQVGVLVYDGDCQLLWYAVFW